MKQKIEDKIKELNLELQDQQTEYNNICNDDTNDFESYKGTAMEMIKEKEEFVTFLESLLS